MAFKWSGHECEMIQVEVCPVFTVEYAGDVLDQLQPDEVDFSEITEMEMLEICRKLRENLEQFILENISCAHTS